MSSDCENICPECGSIMDWNKNHYVCNNCGLKGRFLLRFIKFAILIIVFAGILSCIF